MYVPTGHALGTTEQVLTRLGLLLQRQVWTDPRAPVSTPGQCSLMAAWSVADWRLLASVPLPGRPFLAENGCVAVRRRRVSLVRSGRLLAGRWERRDGPFSVAVAVRMSAEHED